MNFILIKNVPDKKELDSRIDKLVTKRVRELESALLYESYGWVKGILSSPSPKSPNYPCEAILILPSLPHSLGILKDISFSPSVGRQQGGGVGCEANLNILPKDGWINKRRARIHTGRGLIRGGGVKGVFLSYLEHKAMLGSFEELLDLDVLKSAINSCLLSQFESGKLYTILINIIYVENGVIRGSTPMKSIIITAESNVSFHRLPKAAGKIIQNKIIRASNEYNFIDQSCQVQVIWRQWLRDEEYSNLN